MGTVDHTKIITAGDLQRFLSVVDPDTPICGYCTYNGVSYYPIYGPVIILTGEITIDKPLEVKK